MRLDRKNKLLLIGFIVVLFLCYHFAISKTIYYYNLAKNQSDAITSFNNNPKILAQLMLKEKQIDGWLQENNSYSTSFQNELLKELTYYSSKYHLKITDFQEPHKFTDKNSTTTSYCFTLEGSFNNALMLLNNIENKHNLGIVKHVNVLKKINYKTNQEYLNSTVIIQKIEGIQ